MDNKHEQPMTPLDCMVSNQTMQLIKLMIPYLPSQSQRMLAIYIKYMEFQNTLTQFHILHTKSTSMQDIIDDIRPYMSTSTMDTLDNVFQAMNMMEMFQSMYDDTDSNFGFDPMEMMQTMFTAENNMQPDEGGVYSDGLDE